MWNRETPHCPIEAVSRREAISGINNAVSFAACMEIFNVVRDELILNMDGTQYTVGNTDDKKKGSQVVHVGKYTGSRSFFLHDICVAYSIFIFIFRTSSSFTSLQSASFPSTAFQMLLMVSLLNVLH